MIKCTATLVSVCDTVARAMKQCVQSRIPFIYMYVQQCTLCICLKIVGRIYVVYMYLCNV